MENSQGNFAVNANSDHQSNQASDPAANRRKLAQRLRNCTFLPEYRLWKALAEAHNQTSFLRQQVIQEFIVDIYCPDCHLVIEVDGDVHDLKYGQNSRRHKLFNALGLQYLRVSNTEIKQNLTKMLSEINDYLVLPK